MLPKGSGPISTTLREHDARINRLDGQSTPGTISDIGPRGRVVSLPRSRAPIQRRSTSSSAPRWG